MRHGPAFAACWTNQTVRGLSFRIVSAPFLQGRRLARCLINCDLHCGAGLFPRLRVDLHIEESVRVDKGHVEGGVLAGRTATLVAPFLWEGGGRRTGAGTTMAGRPVHKRESGNWLVASCRISWARSVRPGACYGFVRHRLYFARRIATVVAATFAPARSSFS